MGGCFPHDLSQPLGIGRCVTIASEDPIHSDILAARFSTARVITVSSMALMLTAPGQTAAISVFVNHLQQDLRLSSSSVASAYLIGSLAGGWTKPLLGLAIDRWGPRMLMAIVGGVFGAVLVALSTVTDSSG